MNKFKTISALLAALSMVFVMSVSHATTYSFVNVENNSSLDLSTQLSAEVTMEGDDAWITLKNDVDGGSYASITDIYFGYNELLTSVSFLSVSGANVAFTDGASPANLSGGTFISDYSADANSGDKNSTLKSNGVDATGEWIRFLVDLGTGFDYSNLLAAIDNGSFNIGVHVQALTDNDLSDSYEVSTVPVPAAAWLFGTALFGFFAASRRKKIS